MYRFLGVQGLGKDARRETQKLRLNQHPGIILPKGESEQNANVRLIMHKKRFGEKRRDFRAVNSKIDFVVFYLNNIYLFLLREGPALTNSPFLQIRC